MMELEQIVINPSQNPIDFGQNAVEEEVKTALIDEVFRLVYVIEGLTDRLGFNKMKILSLEAERVVNILRKNEIAISPRILRILFNYTGLMNNLMTEINSQGKEQTDIRSALESIRHLLSELKEENLSSISPNPSKRRTEPVTDLIYAPDNWAVQEELTGVSVGTGSKLFDNLAKLLGELVLIRNGLNQIS